VLEERRTRRVSWRLGDTDPLMLQISHDIGWSPRSSATGTRRARPSGRVADLGPATLGADHPRSPGPRAYLGQTPDSGTLGLPVPTRNVPRPHKRAEPPTPHLRPASRRARRIPLRPSRRPPSCRPPFASAVVAGHRLRPAPLRSRRRSRTTAVMPVATPPPPAEPTTAFGSPPPQSTTASGPPPREPTTAIGSAAAASASAESARTFGSAAAASPKGRAGDDLLARRQFVLVRRRGDRLPTAHAGGGDHRVRTGRSGLTRAAARERPAATGRHARLDSTRSRPVDPRPRRRAHPDRPQTRSTSHDHPAGRRLARRLARADPAGGAAAGPARATRAIPGQPAPISDAGPAGARPADSGQPIPGQPAPTNRRRASPRPTNRRRASRCPASRRRASDSGPADSGPADSGPARFRPARAYQPIPGQPIPGQPIRASRFRASWRPGSRHCTSPRPASRHHANSASGQAVSRHTVYDQAGSGGPAPGTDLVRAGQQHPPGVYGTPAWSGESYGGGRPVRWFRRSGWRPSRGPRRRGPGIRWRPTRSSGRPATWCVRGGDVAYRRRGLGLFAAIAAVLAAAVAVAALVFVLALRGTVAPASPMCPTLAGPAPSDVK